MTQLKPSTGLSVTLHHVAARAGVSIATVSRALNGLPVSPESLLRVNEAADELGYVPNETARSLRNVRTMTMGLLFHTLGPGTGLELLESVTAAVEEEGYTLFVSTARGDDSRLETLLRRMLERRVDAVLCAYPRGNGAILGRYAAAGIPVVALFSRGTSFESLPLVAASTQGGADAAVARLAELGHRKLGVVLSRRGPALRVVASAAKAIGLEVVTEGPLTGPFDPTAYLARNAALDEPATAIFALYDQAERLRETAPSLGIAVPSALSICAVHANTAAPGVGARFTSAIHVNPDLVGRTAATVVLRWLAGEAPPRETRVEVATWSERATTGPAPKAAERR